MIKIITNPNENLVKEIRQRLKENENYCPCRILKNEDSKCMCREFREQIKEGRTGECHCGLYMAIEE